MGKTRFNVKGRQKVETIIDNSSIKQVKSVNTDKVKRKFTNEFFRLNLKLKKMIMNTKHQPVMSFLYFLHKNDLLK